MEKWVINPKKKKKKKFTLHMDHNFTLSSCHYLYIWTSFFIYKKEKKVKILPFIFLKWVILKRITYNFNYLNC